MDPKDVGRSDAHTEHEAMAPVLARGRHDLPHQVTADAEAPAAGQHGHPQQVGNVTDIPSDGVPDRLGPALVVDLGQPHRSSVAEAGELLLDRARRPRPRREHLELEHDDGVQVVGSDRADVGHGHNTCFRRPGIAASGRRR